MVEIANEHSIAFGCAAKLCAFGAELAVTYLNYRAKPYVRPLAQEIDAVLSLDVQQPGRMEAVFEQGRQQWDRLDFFIYSIAFAPRQDLHGRVTDCSPDGFQQAMFVSCYSFIEMARRLMSHGGCLIAMGPTRS